MPTLGPFQCKDDHLTAFGLKAKWLLQIIQDFRSEETGYTKYSRDLQDCLDDLRELSDLTLSDPPDPYSFKKFTERLSKEYEDRINYNQHLPNQFLPPPIL